MSKINLYKIDDRFQRKFIENCDEKLEKCAVQIYSMKNQDIEVGLYKEKGEHTKPLSWNWILEEFEQPQISIGSYPKAILVILIEDDYYAITFGSSFFLVDKFCDRDFAFNFARRVRYKEIKTTTSLLPNGIRNKSINTFINYEQLQFDSGESYAKLKVKLDLTDFPDYVAETIEIGNSLKFEFKTNKIENIIDMIFIIEQILTKEEIYKIPVFTKVIDKDKIAQLNHRLHENVSNDLNNIAISELDIIGVSEVFNNADTKFELWYGGKHDIIDDLTIGELQSFADKKKLTLATDILDIKVKSYYNGTTFRTDKIRELIDYTDDTARCVLNKGNWYYFNDDYLSYLENSINEIETYYDSNYDFSGQIHNDFLETKYSQEKNEEAFKTLNKNQVIGKLKTKYYAERAFNIIREKDGFKNYDRNTFMYGKASIELMDLLKDDSIYAVKIGNSSSKLCYAVDQSVSTLKTIKHGKFDEVSEIKNVVVWLILKRSPLSLKDDGTPNLNDLNMLMLKNKLDAWKKEVRLLGLKPIIYINYEI